MLLTSTLNKEKIIMIIIIIVIIIINEGLGSF